MDILNLTELITVILCLCAMAFIKKNLIILIGVIGNIVILFSGGFSVYMNIILVTAFIISYFSKKYVTKIYNNMNEIKNSSLEKEEFLWSFSAGIREPLNIVLGFSELILSSPEDFLKTKEYIVKIKTHGQDLSCLVNNALNLSKTEYIKINTAPIKNVLLVDDSFVNLQLTKKLFNRLGITPDTAQEACEALEKVSDNKYDIIFTDYVMPEMNGIELTRRIRLNGINTPVILLTADSNINPENTDGILLKPLSLSKLKKALNI